MAEEGKLSGYGAVAAGGELGPIAARVSGDEAPLAGDGGAPPSLRRRWIGLMLVSGAALAGVSMSRHARASRASYGALSAEDGAETARAAAATAAAATMARAAAASPPAVEEDAVEFLGDEGGGSAELAAESPAWNYHHGHVLNTLTISTWTEGYAPKNRSWYPWNTMVEPHKNTHFRAQDYSQTKTYHWRIESLCNSTTPHMGCGDEHGGVSIWRHGKNGAFYYNGSSPEIVVVFRKAGTQYALSLDAYDITNASTGSINGLNIMCKYVRREVRELTRSERDTFFSALETTHRLGVEEGQDKFGGRYMDAVGLTRKHLARMTLDRCTPWHNGKVFFTAHAAFTLEMEQSLQASLESDMSRDKMAARAAGVCASRSARGARGRGVLPLRVAPSSLGHRPRAIARPSVCGARRASSVRCRRAGGWRPCRRSVADGPGVE